MAQQVIIIGASVAGIGAAAELRRCGYGGRIVLVDAQQHLPYDKPPLSKAILTGETTPDGIRFNSKEELDQLQIELRLGQRVTALDPQARTVTLDAGEVLSGDAIILAMGARARQFPASAWCEGVVTVRDLDDATLLYQKLRTARKLAVIGGGFIGAEVASSARKLGVRVTVFELDEMPFLRILGRDVAERLVRLHHGAGVEVRTGVRVVQVSRTDDGRYALQLQDGSIAVADLVVAGLGAIPNTEMLSGSGLEVGDGIVCDEYGRTSHPGIYAAGDVANWPNPYGFPRHRDEHWTSAREQARIVAQEIVEQRATAWNEYVPYFWSDMHGKRVQVLGSPQYADAVRYVFEDEQKGAFLAEYGRAGVLVGVAGCNAAVRLMKYRAKLPQQPAFESP